MKIKSFSKDVYVLDKRVKNNDREIAEQECINHISTKDSDQEHHYKLGKELGSGVKFFTGSTFNVILTPKELVKNIAACDKLIENVERNTNGKVHLQDSNFVYVFLRKVTNKYTLRDQFIMTYVGESEASGLRRLAEHYKDNIGKCSDYVAIINFSSSNSSDHINLERILLFILMQVLKAKVLNSNEGENVNISRDLFILGCDIISFLFDHVAVIPALEKPTPIVNAISTTTTSKSSSTTSAPTTKKRVDAKTIIKEKFIKEAWSNKEVFHKYRSKLIKFNLDVVNNEIYILKDKDATPLSCQAVSNLYKKEHGIDIDSRNIKLLNLTDSKGNKIIK